MYPPQVRIATINLSNLARALADRKPGRTEATVQSNLHALLLAAPLQLEEHHLQDIVLEQPAGQRRRIDVEVGQCVFEVKRDLRKANVREDGEVQLSGYVINRSEQTSQRYVGVLTDGCEWRLYRLHAGKLAFVSSHEVSAEQPNIEELCVWLEGVLATGEQLAPTPREIEHLLGAQSPGHLLDIADLMEFYEANRDAPGVRLKRRLWAKLLTTALGTAFRDEDRLFVQHTLLVVTAEVIAHAILDIDPRHIPALALVTGQQFRVAKVLGVVEADFFDWVVDVEGGDRFVRDLARRLSRFAWSHVEHDVLKVLYESVIPASQRKQLGEYYTPDWLAEHIVEETVQKPLTSRVLDPSCGSGTFVFYAVRKFLAAADAEGMPNKEALARVCSQVMGMDLHPVAVTLARVTYLLAIGAERLNSKRGPISIPVFLGDSLQWGQEETLQTHGALVVSADEGPELFSTELRFPDSVVADAGGFDSLVAELAELATNQKVGKPPPSLAQVHRRYGTPAADQATIDKTFRTMCALHDQGRDHIWGYYVRNLARPRWLAREPNRVDILVGNPPWLSYRYMTSPMQEEFKLLLKERDLWVGAKSVTHLDLSALFVVRTIERYLKTGGSFAFVMPWAALSRQHFAGFRRGVWPREQGFPVCVAFEEAWDLHNVKPPFFEVPCSVLRGRRVEDEWHSLEVPQIATVWTGRIAERNMGWTSAEPLLKAHRAPVLPATTATPKSPYAARFAQGASLVPRMLCFVEELPSGPLGTVSGELRVRSRRRAAEKKPWKNLPALEGTVESNFVFPVHVGETILPYKPLEPLRGVIPWDGKRVLHGGEELLARYRGLHEWWTRAESVWSENRSSERLTLVEQFDYRGKLANQFTSTGLCPPIRVVYSKSGMYLAAAVLVDPAVVVDHKLYWAACATAGEARYLATVLNSDHVTLSVRKYQARGEHNPRDFDMYVWQLPIPAFDSGDPHHARLAALGAKAETFVGAIDLPNTRFEKQRRYVRERLGESELGKEINAAAKKLLEGG